MNQFPVFRFSTSTRCPALSSFNLRFSPALVKMFAPVFGSGKYFKSGFCSRRERPGWDHAPGENASRRVTAAIEAVGLTAGNSVAEPVRQHLGPVRAIYGGRLTCIVQERTHGEDART